MGRKASQARFGVASHDFFHVTANVQVTIGKNRWKKGVYAHVTHDSIGLVQGASGTERRQRLILHSVPQFTRSSVGCNAKTGPCRVPSHSSVGRNVKTGPYRVASRNSVGRNMIQACFGVVCLDVPQHGSRHGLTSARFSRDSWLLRDSLALAALVAQGFLELGGNPERILR